MHNLRSKVASNADAQTARRGIVLQRPGDSSFRSRRAVSFKGTYIATLQEHRIKISVAQRGRPWENGYAERLIRTLKEEEVHTNDYADITEAREHIEHFITQVYHQKRPHSALRYLTPVEFQQQTLS